MNGLAKGVIAGMTLVGLTACSSTGSQAHHQKATMPIKAKTSQKAVTKSQATATAKKPALKTQKTKAKPKAESKMASTKTKKTTAKKPATKTITDKEKQAKINRWKGTNVKAGLVTNTGNTNSQNITIGTNIQYAIKRWTYTGLMDYQRQKSNGTVSADRLFMQAQAQYALSERNYVYVQGNYTNNKFDGYVYVFNETVGYGRYFNMPKNLTWSIFLGPGMRQRKLVQSAGGGRTNEAAMQLGTNFTWQISPEAKFSEQIQSDMAKENIHNSSVTSLITTITNHLGLNVSFLVTQDTKPVANKKAVNTTTTLQLVYNF